MGEFYEVTVKVRGKRPDYATPALARQLKMEGKTVLEIARMWRISRAQVYNILKQP